MTSFFSSFKIKLGLVSFIVWVSLFAFSGAEATVTEKMPEDVQKELLFLTIHKVYYVVLKELMVTQPGTEKNFKDLKIPLKTSRKEFNEMRLRAAEANTKFQKPRECGNRQDEERLF